MVESKISIIVPVYNSEKYIRTTIDSILLQTYKNLDIIIVDDGSTDSSVEICDDYVDPRIRTYHNKHKGLSVTRQFGVDQAIGDYLCTIDSDDFYDSKYVERMISKIKEEDSDICLCERYDFKDGTEEYILNKLKCLEEAKKISKKELAVNLRQIAAEYVLSDSWNKLYRTSFVRKSGVKFDLSPKYNGNDLAFNYKLVLHCPKICSIKEPLLYHRNAVGSMVHQRKHLMQEGFEVIIGQINQEAEKCNINLGSQIGKIYYGLLSLVALNIIYYSDNRKDELKVYLERNKTFQKNMRLIREPYLRSDYNGIVQQEIVRYTMSNDYKGLCLFAEAFVLLRKIKNLLK